MHTQRGFTLIELLVVGAIIAILAAVAVPSYTRYVAKGKHQNAVLALESARLSMENYRAKNGGYLTAGASVESLPGYDPTVWNGVAKDATYTLVIEAATRNTFTVRATCSPSGSPPCNIDTDATADVWTINERGELMPVETGGVKQDDVDN